MISLEGGTGKDDEGRFFYFSSLISPADLKKPKPTSNNLNRSGIFFIWNAKCTHSHTYIYINIYIYVSFTKLRRLHYQHANLFFHGNS